LGFHHL
jgi:hypothetical protein